MSAFQPFRPAQPTGPYPIKGITLEDGENPGIRRELREVKEDPKLWDLYLLGLWQFQLVPEKDQLSYFQIAGIHGRPYQGWPINDPNLDKIQKVKNAGFCTHTSILFLTWHRPYMALFESILREAMIFVAEQFTDEEGRDEYRKLAKSFRMPYWDWAREDLPVFPLEATEEKLVEVTMPKKMREHYSDLGKSGQNVKIPNPLFRYEFPKDTSRDLKINGLGTTTRWDRAGAEPLQQKGLLMRNITPFSREVNQDLPVEGNLRERVVYLLKSYELFDQVSHNRWDPNRVPNTRARDPEVSSLGFGSIEDIHNAVHGLVGGDDGHMSHIDRSAFDPVFWLHHTNIDRIVSIWEGLHANIKKPETWVTTKESGSNTWVTPSGNMEGLNTPLVPFYKDNTNFWTSNDVRSTIDFGYAYPETQSWDFKDKPDEYRKDIYRQLDSLYSTGSLGTMMMSSRSGNQQPENELKERAKRLAKITAADAPNTTATALSVVGPSDSQLASIIPPLDVPNVEVPSGRSLTKLVKDNTYLEWLVNIKAVKHCQAVGGHYQIHVFLGEKVPEDEPTALYTVSPFHVGTFNPLGQSDDTACGKCQQDQEAGTEITGQIPLTIALTERYFAGELGSLGEHDVQEYLKKNLHWEVVDHQGVRRKNHRGLVTGLRVGVVSNLVTLPANDQGFPRYSQNITIYPEITTKESGDKGRAEETGITKQNLYFN